MHIDQLLLQIAAILLVARLFGRALKAVGQPQVIAEIVAGIALGPSLLGALSPGTMAWLFPTSSLDVLGTVAQLGLVFFMFLVGLEFDPRLLQGRGRAAFAISGAGILAPLLLGIGVATQLPADLSRPGVPLHSFALFVGVAMGVTAFPVLARILAERRLVKTPVGALALAAAAVDDVSAWCLLAVVVGIASSAGVGAALGTVALALLYAASVWFLVRPVLQRLGPREGHEVSMEVVALTVLIVAISALITERIGIHALFGGFLIGAAMPRRGGLSHVLIEKMEDFVTIVLLPLFFAYSGLRTQVGLLDDATDWLICLLLLVVAVVGKFGGSALAARWTGLGLRESAAIGVLMNTRGLMEIVVLNVGLDLGVISERMFAMMVIVAIVTTWMTTPILRRLYSVEVATAAPPVPGPATALQPVPAGILLCVSDPRLAAPLVGLTRVLLRTDEPVWALHLRPVERPRDYLRDDAESATEDEPLAAVERAASAAGLRHEALSFTSADPAEDIVRIASLKGARLVLLGTHRSSLGLDSLRGIAGAVLRDCATTVCVLLDRGLSEVRRVKVEADGPHAAAIEALVHSLHPHQVQQVPASDPAPVDLRVRGHGAEGGLARDPDASLLIVRGAQAA